MKITIIAVGKIKEKYLKDAILEYEKRLSKYAKLSIIEAEDERTIEQASLNEQALKKEAGRILRLLKPDTQKHKMQKHKMLVIALEITGKTMDSEAFAAYLDQMATAGNSHITFIIGGSLGLHQSISEIADLSLSFSAMTFPHQLMRVILLEQIYRAFRIMGGEPYHK
ncbi:MAG: 23S rRNA (pseudouridine(1915)-N(3))-methyltransferase RlmH [Lachnospiraceae bacterium]|nr:23S rRNA (pseudouridine(1915)-N(3))-methyltransferase RlmH [Lachnospiraceae bacterium]